MALNWKDVAETTKNFVEATAVLIGGGWAFWNYVLRRERYARIEVEVELTVLGTEHSARLAELAAVVHNRGAVRQWIHSFTVDLHYLPAGAPLADDEVTGQVVLQTAFVGRSVFAQDVVAMFVDPDVAHRFTYLTHLPMDAAYALVYFEFEYPDSADEYHVAYRAFSLVPQVVTSPKGTG